MKFTFTPQQIKAVKQRFDSMKSKELHQWFVKEYGVNVQYTTFRHRLYDHGLYKVRMLRWTPEETQFLHDNYPTMGNIELADNLTQLFGRKFTKKNVEKKIVLDKIKRTPDQLEYIREQHKERGVYREANLKLWQSRGVNPVGTIVKWKRHTLIKTNKGYVHYNRWLWEQTHGPLTSDDIVRRIDPDKPLTISNLKVVTRAENAQLNAIKFHAYPPELKRAIKQLNKLNKNLNDE